MRVSRTRTNLSADSLMRSRRTTCPSNSRQSVQGTHRTTTMIGLPLFLAWALPSSRLESHPNRPPCSARPLGWAAAGATETATNPTARKATKPLLMKVSPIDRLPMSPGRGESVSARRPLVYESIEPDRARLVSAARKEGRGSGGGPACRAGPSQPGPALGKRGLPPSAAAFPVVFHPPGRTMPGNPRPTPRPAMLTVRAAPAADLELLRKYDTPTVCNVVELFDLRPRSAGYMNGRIQCCYPKLPPMVGYACTATFRSVAPPRAGNVYAGLGDQVAAFAELPGPAVVVFQDLDDPCAAATFGEVMCTTYKAFGAAGLITSGAARDLDQVEPLHFPCFSNGAICAHGYPQIVQINVPVHVGGVMVHPVDLLHGDRNGVTTIPNEVASATARACAEYMAAEGVIFEYLKSGKIDVPGFNKARKECGERIAALERKLKSGLERR